MIKTMKQYNRDYNIYDYMEPMYASTATNTGLIVQSKMNNNTPNTQRAMGNMDKTIIDIIQMDMNRTMDIIKLNDNIPKTIHVNTLTNEKKVSTLTEKEKEQMQAVIDVIEKITSEANTRKNTETRHYKSFPVGKHIRQGDIYIHAVPSNHAHGMKAESHQLAQGNSQGSRHFADNNAKVFEGTTLPKGVANGTFLGPYFESDKEILISHPEHADHIIPPGCYQVTHQMDARTLQRVRD